MFFKNIFESPVEEQQSGREMHTDTHFHAHCLCVVVLGHIQSTAHAVSTFMFEGRVVKPFHEVIIADLPHASATVTKSTTSHSCVRLSLSQILLGVNATKSRSMMMPHTNTSYERFFVSTVLNTPWLPNTVVCLILMSVSHDSHLHVSMKKHLSIGHRCTSELLTHLRC